MRKIFMLLFVTTIFCGCGGNSKNINEESAGAEFHCISYRAKDNSFSEAYGSNVYYKITLGNKLNEFAASAILADEKGVNVFGKLMGGQAGLATIVDGTYKIENGNVIINWDKKNILENLPNTLKIGIDGFTNKRVNSKVTSLNDSEHKMNYSLNESWNVK
jgi:hypothetical protein